MQKKNNIPCYISHAPLPSKFPRCKSDSSVLGKRSQWQKSMQQMQKIEMDHVTRVSPVVSKKYKEGRSELITHFE